MWKHFAWAFWLVGCAHGAYAPSGAYEVAPVAQLEVGYELDYAEPTEPAIRMTSADSSVLTSSQVVSGRQQRAYERSLAPDENALPEIAEPQAALVPRYAQRDPAPASGTATPRQAPDVRAVPSSMLIYTAMLVVAVLDVEQKQARLIERAREMGGFLGRQTGDLLTVRVPAARFDEFVSAVAEIGQVLHRNVEVTDVGEEFRDVAVRIQNLEAVRQRFEQMLAQANNVETGLAIQRELERVTTELEVLKGRQRHLADQVALSTITIRFEPLATVEPGRETNLPFPWLRQLGLRNLLTLEHGR